jgi:carboxymethylenebutenolidase
MTIRKKASDFDPRILELYDGYVHGRMSKRQFLDHATKYAVGGVSAAALLESLQPNYALAQQVAPDDPAIVTERVEYSSPEGTGTIRALMARPAGAEGPLPAVLVIHENRGLNPYIEDVVRRLGKAGYLGLSSLGGYPGNDDEGREMQSSLDPAKLMQDFFAGFQHLLDHPDSTGRVGAVGFCYGGGVVNALGGVPGDGGGGAVLRPPGRCRGRSGDPGAADAALRGTRRADKRGLAGVRGGAEGARKGLRGIRLPGSPARLS